MCRSRSILRFRRQSPSFALGNLHLNMKGSTQATVIVSATLAPVLLAVGMVWLVYSSKAPGNVSDTPAVVEVPELERSCIPGRELSEEEESIVLALARQEGVTRLHESDPSVQNLTDLHSTPIPRYCWWDQSQNLRARALGTLKTVALGTEYELQSGVSMPDLRISPDRHIALL